MFGTRPEAIKMAPLVLALRAAEGFEVIVAVTGQHRDMLDQVLDLFGIIPDFDLNIQEPRQALGQVTTRVLQGLQPLVADVEPDLVMVQGDTTTTFTGALAAFYGRVPVAHVEAGLRTGDRYSPYPEEVNRRLTTQLASLHLTPTANARDNLLREGLDRSAVVVTGNSVIDALLWAVEQQAPYGDPALSDLDSHDRPVLLVTAHRRESWGPAMASVGHALADIARSEPDLLVVFPVHPNPAVREAILPPLGGLDNVRVLEPLSYGSFARLMARSTLVLTDSGGIQEEAPSLGKPVLVMRDTTERPEAVSAGTARLIGTDRMVVGRAVLDLLRNETAYNDMANAVNPYGDGWAARRTVAALRHFFGEGPPSDEFGD